MSGFDDVTLSIARSSPTSESVEALAALTDEQRWDIVTYCLIEEASCADLPEWEAAIEEACGRDDAPAACAIVAEFFEEVEKIFSEDESEQTASSNEDDQESQSSDDDSQDAAKEDDYALAQSYGYADE